MWYGEMNKYDFSKNAYKSECGHFSQVVWNGSNKLGMGLSVVVGSSTFCVGDYWPRGNSGDYVNNVFPLKS